ncbi:Outer membrane protein TolC [Methylophilaceae bacterium]|nr:Outer membrane protein TolC [Methylophilaceae bacterium]
MNRFINNTVIMMAALLASASAAATAATDNLVSLYQKALQYDAQYRSAVANTEADREEINKAKSLFLPKVQLAANMGRGVTDRTAQTMAGPVETNYDYTIRNYALSVKQPLFNKESMASYRGTQAVVKGREALLQRESSVLISRVASTYFEILYAQERVAVIGNKINAVQQQLDQAQRRYSHGEGTITEINEAQANLDLAKAELIEANNSLSIFKQALSDMTGQPVDEIAALNPDQLPTSMPETDSLEDWLRDALDNNPDIAAARHALEAAQHDVERKRAGHYPTLDLVGVRSYSENDNNNTIGLRFDTTTVAVQFNLPLYAGGYASANTRQAQDRVQAAEEQLNLKTRDTGASIRKYFNRIQSGLLSIQAYEQAVKSGEIALSGTEKGFAAGLRTNIEVLNAQQRLYSSRLDLSKARYMLVNDIVNIKQVAGMLDEAQLRSLNRYFLVN